MVKKVPHPPNPKGSRNKKVWKLALKTGVDVMVDVEVVE
jgi:hypothetical protein